MKIIQTSLIIFSLGCFLFISCGEPEPIIYNGPVFVSFTEDTTGKYILEADNEAYFTKIGIPYPLEYDLEIGLELEHSTAEEGKHFDMPSSVVIRKDNVTSLVKIQGYYENMAERKDTITIRLVGEEVAGFNNTYMLFMRQKMICPLDIEAIPGNWTANETSNYDGAYEPYTVTFEEFPGGGDTVITDDIWPYEVKIAFDSTASAGWVWSIPEQYLFDHEEYGPVFISSVDPAEFDACDLIMSSIRYQVYVETGFFEDSMLELVKD